MSKAPVVLGLAGFGTVGTGLARILESNAAWIERRIGREIQIKTILVRDAQKTRGAVPKGAALTTDLQTLVDDPQIDIVVEVMGGLDTAFELITRALNAGKHVVTANKALLAQRGSELFALAAAKRLGLYFEASVCGGIPIVQTLKESLACNRILNLTGILNGTANYILSKMTAKGLPFAQALQKAQEKGYAEADPTLDIEGFDAAHKLILLIRLAWGLDYPLAELPVKGITGVTPLDIGFAHEFDYQIKLIGRVQDVNGKLSAGVFPMLLSNNYLLAQVQSAFNAVRVEGDAVGSVMLYGKGAGALPTGSAVLSDIMALAKSNCQPHNSGFVDEVLPKAAILDPDLAESRHYFRFNVTDQPGVLAAIAGCMSKRDISIAQAVQKGDPESKDLPIVFLTHKAKARDVNEALCEIDKMPFISSPSVHFRVL